ncbi:DNA polymerase delta subunit 3 isoform X2 [Ahaetulla prasina]|uniref:DNA polymerase delta subunit 3 isoform X2 n=1 Tax=Ahaetulla prasina TaxID=499056 RepID=UPI002648B1ED|nr:DNA polymerase delta subunit 3 isoform X2 [Ahaetulla prasina]
MAAAAAGGRGEEGALWGSRGPGRPVMEDELYLENIDEFVTDQNRVVTYKWLSFTLGVHVNQAKQMLYDYVERKRKENAGAQLHVTYLLAGNLVQNGHTYHKVAVVREDKLEAMKSKFSTLASVHVYSIQKAQLRDSSPLFNTDYDILKANLENCGKFSAICCPDAIIRPVAEGSQAETPAQVSPQPPPPATSVHLAPALNGHAPSTSSKQPAQPIKGIMGMFAAKATSKTKNINKEAKLETKETPSASVTNNSKAPTKGNILNNFFGKAAVSKEDKARAEPEQQKEERSTSKSPVSSTDPKSPLNPPGHEKASKEAEPARGQQRDKKSRDLCSPRAKRTDVSDEEEKGTGRLKKKRRRIKQPQSDSSDDEEDSSSLAISEDNPPAPAQKPQPQPAPAPVEASVGVKKRKRKRVLKSRTFVDEEGCIVTEKAYESESCTESEEEVRTKPSAAHKAPAGPPKKDPKEEKRGTKKGGAVPGKANKQASIMGFFQKK